LPLDLRRALEAQIAFLDGGGTAEGMALRAEAGRPERRRLGTIALSEQGGSRSDDASFEVSPTLRAEAKGHLPVVCAGFSAGQGAGAGGIGYGLETAPTLKGAASGTNQVPCLVMGIDAEKNCAVELMGALKAGKCDAAVAFTPSGFGRRAEGVGTLKANGGDLGGGSETLVFAMQGLGDYRESESASVVKSRDFKSATDLIAAGLFVRRLTPLECERLQGLPDGWTESGADGRKISDSARYRAIGNGLAIPCAAFVMRNVARAVAREEGR